MGELGLARYREVETDGLALAQRGDRLSFNLAALLKQYFGLAGVAGQFSLRLHPYEHGRLDASFEAFVRVLTSV